MTRQTASRNGLDVDAPETGIAADAYEVAATALRLGSRHRQGNEPLPLDAARHAVTLHRISGQLHRLAERACNEDLHCRACDGEGNVLASFPAVARGERSATPCSACAGHGSTMGRRLERLRRQCREIAEHYGLACFFQTDPRGCSLYIGANLTDYNYNNGHAVTRLGR